MQSLLKLNKGDSKGWSHLGSSLNCWYAIIYMIYVELPLSTNTLLVLNPFIANMMTSGLSYGCLIPLASHSEKVMSSSLERTVFYERMLNIDVIDLSLKCPFQGLLRPSSNWPSNYHPYFPHCLFLMISFDIFMVVMDLSSSFNWDWWSFLTNFWSFPLWINSSICSFKSRHSSV